jgi:hypothetical protein
VFWFVKTAREIAKIREDRSHRAQLYLGNFFVLGDFTILKQWSRYCFHNGAGGLRRCSPMRFSW